LLFVLEDKERVIDSSSLRVNLHVSPLSNY